MCENTLFWCLYLFLPSGLVFRPLSLGNLGELLSVVNPRQLDSRRVFLELLALYDTHCRDYFVVPAPEPSVFILLPVRTPNFSSSFPRLPAPTLFPLFLPLSR